MDKKHKASKTTLRQTSPYFPEKPKKVRTITGKSPKACESTAQQKFAQLNKFKKLPLGSKREIYRSALPFDGRAPSRETEKQQVKLGQSSISYHDLPVSFTEKTVKNIRTGDKPKQTSKLVKAKRKTKWFKDEKAEVVEDDKKSIEKGIPTTRKVSKVRDDYQILYKKTEKIMQEYRQREEQWQTEKEELVQELQDFRRKSMGMALTSCSSYSLNRRNMF